MRRKVRVLRLLLVAGALLFVLLFLLLSSCGRTAKTASVYTPAQIAKAVIDAQDNISALETLLPSDDYYTKYLTDIYSLDPNVIEDGVICYFSGMNADEISVFLLNDNSAVKDAENALAKYKVRRADAFRGYAPVQSAIIENSLVLTHGNYVALFICENPKNAQSVFLACFSNTPPPVASNDDNKQNGNSGTAGERPGSEPSPGADPDAPDGATPTPAPTAAAPSIPAPTTPAPSTTAPTTVPSTPTPTTPAPTATAPSTPAPSTTVPAATAPTTAPTAAAPSPPTPTATTPSTPTTTPSTPAPTTPAPTATPSATPSAPPTGKTPGGDNPAGGTPADPEDHYDRAAILKAWYSGDLSGLSNKNKKILEACIEIIGSVTNSGMSDYEKELALHDWIINQVSYDEEAINNSPNAKPDPNNDNPYGVIFSKKAICYGYTRTFQLFMDLVGIECITVEGEYAISGEIHAWNMVRIAGEWYCVDVTWNDPIGNNIRASDRHQYFNVTSQFMRETMHQWDESTTPVADAGKLYFG